MIKSHKMYKIYSVFILSLLAYIYFMAGKKKPDPSTKKEPSNILPLTLINLGDSCIAPSKMETDSWVDKSNLINKGITFLTESEGDQVFMCAIRIAEEDVKSTKVKSFFLPNDDNCTYPIKFNETDPLKCFHEPEPLIQKLQEMKTGPFEVKDIPCGPEKRGKMYRFVYEICMTENKIENKESIELCKLEGNSIKYRSEFEIYKFCYDEKTKTVIHTEHKIQSIDFLHNRKLKHEQEKTFEMMIDNQNYFGLDSDTIKNKYTLLLENQTEQKEAISDKIQNSTNPKPITFQIPIRDTAQKLVPPDHFGLALWRKPTYHYLNLKPMKKELTDLWNYIDLLIRDDAVVRNREYYIHTGAYTKSGGQTKGNMKTEKSSESVDYWLRIIYYSQEKPRKQNDPIQYKAFAILMDNNFDDNNSSDTWFDEKCGEDLCEDAFIGQYPHVGKSVRCCSVIKGNFNEADLKIDQNLETDFLYID